MLDAVYARVMRRSRLALAVVVVVTLSAGLYPFSFWRANTAAWNPGGGLDFGPSSMAISSDTFRWNTSRGPARLGIELWLSPRSAAEADRDILVLHDHPFMPMLRILQSGDDLVLASRVRNADGKRWYNEFRFPRVLAGTHPRHVAIASGAPRPRLLVDGAAVLPTSGVGLPLGRRAWRFAGRLLLGSHPNATGSWEGTFHGLVVHDDEPAWSHGGDTIAPRAPPGIDVPEEPSVVAAYGFSAGSGREVPDLIGGHRLRIPRFYRPVGSYALRSNSPSPFSSLPMLLDALVNLIGFAPLGFCVALVVVRPTGRRAEALAVAAVTGFGASLSIEWLQTLLPTRHSSLLDLGMNGVGAILGGLVCLWFARSGAATSRTSTTVS